MYAVRAYLQPSVLCSSHTGVRRFFFPVYRTIFIFLLPIIRRELAREWPGLNRKFRLEPIARTKNWSCAKFELLLPDFKFSGPKQILKKLPETALFQMNLRWSEINLVQIIYPILARELSIIYEGLLKLADFYAFIRLLLLTKTNINKKGHF
jgi:hypothetical protein